MTMGKGGARPGAGRKPGKTLNSTLTERGRHAKAIATYARRAWKIDRQGPPPPADDTEAAIAYLDRKALFALDAAILARDFRAVAALIEGCRDRLEGRPKYQLEHSGGETPVGITGTIEYVACLADGTPAITAAVPVPERPGHEPGD